MPGTGSSQGVHGLRALTYSKKQEVGGKGDGSSGSRLYNLSMYILISIVCMCVYVWKDRGEVGEFVVNLHHIPCCDKREGR